jgi:hypothetical protein
VPQPARAAGARGPIRLLPCSVDVRHQRRRPPRSLQRQTRSKTCPRISPMMSRATQPHPMRPWVSAGGGSSGGSATGSPAVGAAGRVGAPAAPAVVRLPWPLLPACPLEIGDHPAAGGRRARMPAGDPRGDGAGPACSAACSRSRSWSVSAASGSSTTSSSSSAGVRGIFRHPSLRQRQRRCTPSGQTCHRWWRRPWHSPTTWVSSRAVRRNRANCCGCWRGAVQAASLGKPARDLARGWPGWRALSARRPSSSA